MPISQDRMLSLIEAALDYQRAYEYLCQAVRDSYYRAKAAPATALDEYQMVAMIAEPKAGLKDNAGSAVAIATEHQHFKSFASRNRSERVRQARKRGKLTPTLKPVPPDFMRRGLASDSSPLTMAQPNFQRGKSIAEFSEDEIVRLKIEAANREADEHDAGIAAAFSSPGAFVTIAPDIMEKADPAMLAEHDAFIEQENERLRRVAALQEKMASEKQDG
jgi:hypothetical protein